MIVLLSGESFCQTIKSSTEIKSLLGMVQTDFATLRGQFDSSSNLYISLLTVDQTKDNKITIDTSAGISMYIAFLADSIKLPKAKEIIQEWLQIIKPHLAGYEHTYSPKLDLGFSVINECYDYKHRLGDSEYTFNIQARKNDTNKYYTVSFSISRLWKNL